MRSEVFFVVDSKGESEIVIGAGLKIPTTSALDALRLGWKSIKEMDFGWRELMILGTFVSSIIGIITNFF